MSRNGSLKEQVYYSILEGIFSDEYKPNQILNEQELVRKYGFSKSPIREALLMLCNEGVLRSFPRFGYQIVELSQNDVRNILDYRLIVEANFLRKNYMQFTEAQLRELECLDEECTANTDSIWNHWEANTSFHLKLLSFSNNEFACEQLERSMSVLKRAYAQFYWQKWIRSNTATDTMQHCHIIKALRSKRIEDAIEYLKQDLADFCI